MRDNLSSTQNKWDATVPGVKEVVAGTDTSVSWGLKWFPTGALRCGVSAGVEVPVKAMNATAVNAEITASMPAMKGQSATPTASAVNTATAYLRTVTGNAPKYIVLVTDGEPNCKGGSNDGGEAPDEDGAVAAVAAAKAAGFETFVVGIAADATFRATLNRMAVAGGRPRSDPSDPTAKYYPVNSKTDIVSVLGSIASGITTCEYPLHIPPPNRDYVRVEVTIGSQSQFVPRDLSHNQGWDYVAGGPHGTVQIFGTVCNQLKAVENSTADIYFGCASDAPK
jgi:hypothetical protein